MIDTVSSSAHRILESFSTTRGLVGWVDVLGVRSMPEDRRNLLYDSIAKFLPDYSTNYFKSGEKRFPVNETNSLIVGDSLCITQSSESGGSRLFVVQTTLVFSQYLFSAGFSHRGYLTQGSYRADHPINGLPFITGKAIIDAVNNEESLKFVGIGIDRSALHEFTRLRGRIGNVYWTKDPVFGSKYHLASSELHFSRWRSYCNEHYTEHPYIAAAKTMIEQTSIWDMS